MIESGRGVSVGRLKGILQGISRVGSLVAVIPGGLLADAVGGRQTFVTFAVVTLMALALFPLGRVPRSLGHGT